ncbi:MAG TPA: EAL domain-containing protein [Bryobacteraceae bacterium]|nr:EAL domain-containing protein [Bryobacteraceae bacterium]
MSNSPQGYAPPATPPVSPRAVSSRGAFPAPGSSRLLVVDDEANNRAALARRLTQKGYIVDVAGDGPQALERIPSGRYDLVLLDQMMPGMSGMEVLRRLRSKYSQSELPVIMVTGMDQSKLVVEALRLGANDYVVKPVDSQVVAARIQSQLARSEADRAIRVVDALTGLGTRQLLLDRAAEALVRSESGSLAVILLNLDDHKALADSFGAEAGNQILRQVAGHLKSSMGEAGLAPDAYTIARMDNQFFVLLNHIGIDRTEHLADQILSSVARPVHFEGLDHEISASVGIAIDDSHSRIPQELLHDAGLAANQSRELGKNRWQRFDTGMRERAQARMSIASDLHHAIARGELVAAYQPEVDLLTKEIIGFECLLRWRRPGLGCLMPSEFIHTAEQTNLIISIGAWVVEQACRQLKVWQTKFPRDKPLTMNVNLSVKQLADPDLINCVRRVLTETGIPPETLCFELTESALITEVESARDTLSRLRSLGVGLKLDDFGTGYSSLSYLRSFQFDSLKIDRSFVSKVTSDPETNAIVAMIVHLAHALNMNVVAEGLEDAQQVAEAVRLGCDTAQGYYFAAALERDEADRLLSEARNETPGFAEIDPRA